MVMVSVLVKPEADEPWRLVLQFLQRFGQRIAEHEDLDGCDNCDGSLLEQTNTLPCKLRHVRRPSHAIMRFRRWRENGRLSPFWL